MAKTKKKAGKQQAGKKESVKAFAAKLFDIRDAIDEVAAKIQEGKKFAGRGKENRKEVAHADAMLASLRTAKAKVMSHCCQNDQGCTLFFKKASR